MNDLEKDLRKYAYVILVAVSVAGLVVIACLRVYYLIMAVQPPVRVGDTVSYLVFVGFIGLLFRPPERCHDRKPDRTP